MGGVFGVISKSNCVLDVFFGTDYHSHLGTSRGGMVIAIQKELGLPVKFIGLGEQHDDLQPFDVQQYAEAIFSA